MQVKLAKRAGFCFGVKRAVDMATAARQGGTGPIRTLGSLIHNPQVVARLREAGIDSVASLADIADGTVVIPAHGAVPEVIEAAVARGLEILDATCPFVAKAQALARQLAEEDYRIVVLGDPGHPEVLGLVGCAQGRATVVRSAEEAADLPHVAKLGVVVQTTQTLARLQELVAALVGRARELRVFNTICGATAELQEAALELAREVDVMVVVGGRNSANTARLRLLSESAGIPAHHIETADELRPEWFAGKPTVGVTAGASTPQWLIDDVVGRLRQMGDGAGS